MYSFTYDVELITFITNMRPSKIYIIGCLGSGKSFLGKKLSEKSGVEHFNLDDVVYLDKNFNKREEKERDIILEKIIKKKSFIMEGVYTKDWILPAIEESSLIIYLDITPLTRLYRFIKRNIKQGTLRQKGFFGRSLLVLGFKYKETDRTKTKYERLLKPYQDKMTIIKSEKEVNYFIDKF